MISVRCTSRDQAAGSERDNMELNTIVESAWNNPLRALKAKLDMAAQSVADILLVEEQRQNRGKVENLQQTMGTMAAASLDLSAVSRLLQRGSEKSVLDEAEQTRIKNLDEQLKHWQQEFSRRVPACRITPLHDLQEIEQEAILHLNTMADLFKLMRMAWLERNSRYEPHVHDPFFSGFNWEYLNNDEVALCPPFVVTVAERGDRDFYFSTLLPLVTSGLPVKVVLEKTEFRNRFQRFGRSTALRCSLEIEMLPVALKGVYIMQDSVLRPQCAERLQEGLRSPRPALFSLFNDQDQQRCEHAVLSRALPLFRYDPDQSDVFLKRFDLCENPALDRSWATTTLEYLNQANKKDRLERQYTFADFAAQEAQYQDDFSDLPAAQEARGVEVSEYLLMNPAERSNKLPFIYQLDNNGYLVKKVPSLRIVAQTDDKRHLWQSLCEVAGINNPYLTELEQQVREQAAEAQRKALADLRTELMADIEAERAAAVRAAMGNLAARLTGLSDTAISDVLQVTPAPAESDNSQPSAKASIPASESAEAVAVDSDEAWIETKLCTGCDECTSIDPNIFAYDENKQAYVKDPRGGPYKNIVKAAEKCSAKIIHTGKAF